MSRIGDFDFVTLSLSLSLSSIYDKLRTLWCEDRGEVRIFFYWGSSLSTWTPPHPTVSGPSPLTLWPRKKKKSVFFFTVTVLLFLVVDTPTQMQCSYHKANRVVPQKRRRWKSIRCRLPLWKGHIVNHNLWSWFFWTKNWRTRYLAGRCSTNKLISNNLVDTASGQKQT